MTKPDMTASMSGDQLVFLTVAVIFLACFANAYTVFRQNRFKPGESFWLWGLVFLSVSYIGFGLGPMVGRSGLLVANLTLLLAYVSLGLQLRFWVTEKSNVSPWIYLGCLTYAVLFEILRDTMPYIARASFGHITIATLMGYGLWSSLQLYRRNRSIQILILTSTLVLELICAVARLAMFWLTQDTTAELRHIFNESTTMVALRWIWLLANAISYLTVMTYVLEKTLNRNEELGSLLKEKQQLLGAISKASNSRHSGDLAGLLTHELRQPMTTLQLTASRLSAAIQKGNVQDAQMLADMLSGECSRSANIMTQLEMLFHAKSSKAQGVCLTTLIGNVQAMLASRLAAYRVKLTCHVQNDCVLSGEPTQLEAVMVNIISNAITALADQPDPKLIDLSVLKQDGLCVIDLRDNGPGFDSVVLHHIGKRYISDRQEGTGIGLWLSKLIVESHHGQLNVSNQERGALVHIQLPLYQENNDMKQSA